MRNLQTTRFAEISVEDELPLTSTSWDTKDDSIVCAFGPTPSQPTIALKRGVSPENAHGIDSITSSAGLASITSWDSPCPLPDLQCDEILLMRHFSDNATICLVLAGGDLILVREEPEPGQEPIEIVGSIDVGIAAAEWDPDEELLAVITRADNLVLMSRNLEPVIETTMTVDDLQASKHVAVGWGKKETQFHGKRAKAMRDPTMPENLVEGKPSLYEDAAVSLSWRGDGAFIAVNSIVPNQRRIIRVYSREGVLDSVSEPVDGLESALTWRPAGNLIASTRRSGSGDEHDRLEVVFFERNGLRHGDFHLRLKAPETHERARKISLSWNIDSTVLAVSFLDSVQFWTMGNYHYYLKKEIMLGNSPSDQPIGIRWHPEKALKCCISGSTRILDLEFNMHVHRGSLIVPNDYGTVAVIDGSTLKMTPIKHAGVPPPMSFCDLEAGSNIVDCAISRNGQRIAVLTRSSVMMYDWPLQIASKTSKYQEKRYSTQYKQFEIHLQDLTDQAFVHARCAQLCFQGDTDLYMLAPAQNGSDAQCYRFVLTEGVTGDWTQKTVVQSLSSVNVPKVVHNLYSDIEQENTLIQSGRACGLLRTDSDEPWQPLLTLNSRHSDMASYASTSVTNVMSNGDSVIYHQVYLTAKGALYVDNRLLVRDCTSFLVTDMHIVLTTAQHLLKFVHISDPENMDVPADTPEADERCRSIERGAKLITVIPSIYAVVLQMPRGNLETIYPRVLVVSGIRKSLQALDYRTAFLACQNHQVDMNLLYDHMPDLFMANINRFVSSLKKPSRIDEFLSKLKEEDVTQTLYKDTLKAAGEPVTNGTNTANATQSMSVPMNKSESGKVNQICDAFINSLDQSSSGYLQNIITAHVCKRPPDLTAALTLVSSLRQNDPDEADLAVSHLCFLTDVNRLYDAALGLYDLELTLLVAQNAQRDPREYMPFLQKLQSMPTLRRRYQIDNHLRNYTRALISLHKLDAHDEVQAYTIKHVLYTTTMDLYKYDHQNLPKITTLYAEYLETQSQYASAAILYESLRDYQSAYSLYALAHQWRESLTCASLIPLDPEKLREHARSLATTCTEESRDHRSAATIHMEYLSDIPSAARLFCKGSYFADATRILSLHKLTSDIPIIVDPSLTEKFGEIIELVADCRSQLSAQIPRIQELRQKKAEDPLAFYGGDAAAAAAAAGEAIDIPDNISLAATDASTMGGHSLFTRYGSNASKFGGTVASNVSRKTSKTKRREERKRARGKKGSVYEEEYLISSVGRLIDRVNSVQDEVRRLTNGLLRRGMREQATKVDEVMTEIAAVCEKARKEVWQIDDAPTTTAVTDEGAYDTTGEGRPPGADGVLWDSLQETGGQSLKKSQPPEVKAWNGNPLVFRT